MVMADSLKNQLARFQALADERAAAREILIDAIFKYSGVEVAASALTQHGRALYLRVKPMERIEILLKQKHILRELRDRLGRKAPDKLI